MRKSKYAYKCPRCGNRVGLEIKPNSVDHIPYCYNEEGHHSRRTYKMEWDPDMSKNKEPKL